MKLVIAPLCGEKNWHISMIYGMSWIDTITNFIHKFISA